MKKSLIIFFLILVLSFSITSAKPECEIPGERDFKSYTFCNFENELEFLKEVGEDCNNGYECLSGSCPRSDVCVRTASEEFKETESFFCKIPLISWLFDCDEEEELKVAMTQLSASYEITDARVLSDTDINNLDIYFLDSATAIAPGHIENYFGVLSLTYNLEKYPKGYVYNGGDLATVPSEYIVMKTFFAPVDPYVPEELDVEITYLDESFNERTLKVCLPAIPDQLIHTYYFTMDGSTYTDTKLTEKVRECRGDLIPKKFTFILFNFRDSDLEPFSPDEFRDRHAQTFADYYGEVSYGRYVPEVDVRGWFDLSSDCGIMQGVRNPEVREIVDKYDSDYFVLVYNSPCSGGGSAYSEGVVVGTNYDEESRFTEDNLFTDVIKTSIHEFGHILELGHAGMFSCIKDDCYYGDYDNYYDVMGSGGIKWFNDFSDVDSSSHFSLPAKEFLGWVDEDQIIDVTQNTVNSIYSITRIDGPKGMRIHGLDSNLYYVEYVTADGFNQGLVNMNGMQQGLLITKPELWYGSQLRTVLLTPNMILEGEQFLLPEAGLIISALDMNLQQAEISVEFTSVSCVKNAPIIYGVDLFPSLQLAHIKVKNRNSALCDPEEFELNLYRLNPDVEMSLDDSLEVRRCDPFRGPCYEISSRSVRPFIMNSQEDIGIDLPINNLDEGLYRFSITQKDTGLSNFRVFSI